MRIEDVLPGKKTLIAAVFTFIGGGLITLGYVEMGGMLVSLGVSLGFVGIRYQK